MKEILEKLAKLQYSQIVFLEQRYDDYLDRKEIQEMYNELEEIQNLIKQMS
jgi:hypothetical protein